MTPEEMDFIRQSIASHDRQLGEMVDRQAEIDRKFDRIAEMQEKNSRQIAEHSRQIEEQSRQIEEQSRQIAEQSRQIAEHSIQIAGNSHEIKTAINLMVATMGRLALLVEKHERRIQALET